MVGSHEMGDVTQAAALLRAMSNESRLSVLCYLAEQERSVTELEQYLDLSQSALSQHLAVLRRQGLIRSRRDKRLVYYSVSSEQVTDVLQTLEAHYNCKSIATD